MDCGSTVVQSTDAGWPGTCNNLLANPAATTQTACQTDCQDDPFCSVWMWATHSQTPDDETTAACYAGVGNQCWAEMSGGRSIGTVIKAERLQHGDVNVIMDSDPSQQIHLPRMAITGLQQQFGENVEAGGVPLTAAAQAADCRSICHSNLECSFWQSYYNDGSGSDLGCWTEAPGVDVTSQTPGVNSAGGFVEYPTTTEAFDEDDPDNQYITGGEYIQHLCSIPQLPSRPAITTTTTTLAPVQHAAVVPTVAPPQSSFMNPWGYLIIAAGLMLALAAVAAMVLGGKPQTKKSSRAVKPIKAKEVPPPAPPPLPVPQYVEVPQRFVPLMAPQMMVQPTIPQPLTMTMIQQPTTVAAPAFARRPY